MKPINKGCCLGPETNSRTELLTYQILTVEGYVGSPESRLSKKVLAKSVYHEAVSKVRLGHFLPQGWLFPGSQQLTFDRTPSLLTFRKISDIKCHGRLELEAVHLYDPSHF
ncbi:hypothetical protein RRG08_039207 [Elysia crispata]|uniref:Uncharacterized protein n=1 Tax=Elysia crispata TaxID=231223 RepID=A0AAE1AU78_9GAST|nr:hypothetical protein RRG08_039207 [Elysia crispata]